MGMKYIKLTGFVEPKYDIIETQLLVFIICLN
jgi:hypothetical protein